jgi:hypothetical protein
MWNKVCNWCWTIKVLKKAKDSKRKTEATSELNYMKGWGSGYILVKSFILFMPWGRNDFSLCIQNFSLSFLSASVQCALWSITTTDMSCHLWPARLKCSATGSWIRFVLMVDRWLLIFLRRSPVSPTYCNIYIYMYLFVFVLFLAGGAW